MQLLTHFYMKKPWYLYKRIAIRITSPPKRCYDGRICSFLPFDLMILMTVQLHRTGSPGYLDWESGVLGLWVLCVV